MPMIRLCRESHSGFNSAVIQKCSWKYIRTMHLPRMYQIVIAEKSCVCIFLSTIHFLLNGCVYIKEKKENDYPVPKEHKPFSKRKLFILFHASIRVAYEKKIACGSDWSQRDQRQHMAESSSLRTSLSSISRGCMFHVRQ